ncbi:hypothetical protein HU200_005147 [Digitaria exilis]|uniref:Uncharacterized protein n=1 Tax=Digitaria exilis TaxID=1010633 RepID=A0A835BV55_9POAL|nr:hypothetical protein HU200_028835 [Digitaria exilis]KAF8774933.1 hypothetical protein HU200_005147 [Digitaria exilis]
MPYETAAAIALRNHLRHVEEKKGGARSHGQQKKQVKDESVGMRCGVRRILRQVLPFSGASQSSGKK